MRVSAPKNCSSRAATTTASRENERARSEPYSSRIRTGGASGASPSAGRSMAKDLSKAGKESGSERWRSLMPTPSRLPWCKTGCTPGPAAVFREKGHQVSGRRKVRLVDHKSAFLPRRDHAGVCQLFQVEG